MLPELAWYEFGKEKIQRMERVKLQEKPHDMMYLTVFNSFSHTKHSDHKSRFRFSDLMNLTGVWAKRIWARQDLDCRKFDKKCYLTLLTTIRPL